ncbi:MAG: hypothetical protein NVS3B21_26040 [Acidimicrobiales bacterium]
MAHTLHAEGSDILEGETGTPLVECTAAAGRPPGGRHLQIDQMGRKKSFSSRALTGPVSVTHVVAEGTKPPNFPSS